MIPAFIILFLAAGGIAFLKAPPRWRSLIALSSIFLTNLELEIGVGLNLPVLLSLLSAMLLVHRKVSIHSRFVAIASNRLVYFAVWIIAVWLVGFVCVDVTADAAFGWTRNSTFKPFVQLARLAMLVPFTLVIADGLRTRADVRWFLSGWACVALASAVLCMLQVGAFELFGHSLGTYRVHQGKFELTFAHLGDSTQVRANGLAGEPKGQGLAMAISTCMLLSTFGRGILLVPRWTHLACILAVELALVLTLSSGAIVMAAILFVLVLVSSSHVAAKLLVAAQAAMVIVVIAMVPGPARALWEWRLNQVADIAFNLRGEGYGMEKERPAMIYLLDNPQATLTGVGVGMGPYYFEPRITLPDFRRKYVDPNSGIVWGLYSFGFIGWSLFLWGIFPEIAGRGIARSLATAATLLLRFVLSTFFLCTPLWWLSIAVAVTCAPGAQEHDESVAPAAT